MTFRRSLFVKYVTLIVVLVSFVLVASSAVGLYFSSKENVAQLEALQREKALAAATRIELYIKDIEHEMAWTTLPQIGSEGGALEQRRFEYLKLLRQAPAISELVWVDKSGHEQLRVSRLALDVVGGGGDMSNAAYFKPGSAGVYFGPVYFRKETEPYMTIARPAGGAAEGVIAAEVNLKFVWEVITQIRAGKNGVAYVVNSDGTLIAHPDISLVLQKTNLAALPQVAAVISKGDAAAPSIARDPKGNKVLSAEAPIPTLDWHVFVEAPLEQAFAPLYASMWRTGLLLVASLVLAVLASLFLARRMVLPIRTLQAGTEKLGAGKLDQRIEVRTGDELEALATQFNQMAGRLSESYANLEKKVQVRTHELTESLAQQTATSEVLKVISGSMTELQPVFDAIVQSCSHLFGGAVATMWLREGDKLVARGRAGTDRQSPVPVIDEIPLDEQSMLGTAVTTAQPLHGPDLQQWVDKYPRLTTVGALAQGFKSVLIAPLVREGNGIGALIVLRRTVGEFTPKEQTLLGTFADQATIAIQNVRLFNETKEALQQQTATAEILKVISSSPTDIKPVFDIILEKITALCEADMGLLNLFREGKQRTVAERGGHPEFARWLFERGEFTPPAGSGNARVLAERKPIYIEDYAQSGLRHPLTSPLVELGGVRSYLLVPLLLEDRVVGSISIYRREVKPFTDKQIALVETFASQAVIAIENVRLFNETKEALEQQTATAEILRVISRTTSDVKPVFEAIVNAAQALAGASGARLFTYDGELIHYETGAGTAVTPEWREYARHAYPAAATTKIYSGQAILSKQLVQWNDSDADARLQMARGLVRRRGLAVPMLREGEAIGALTVGWDSPGDVPDKIVKLVQTFANQAVIAIENVRLFNETREALEQQTATAEVLRVISKSPTDVQPVLDAVAERAEMLCDGASVVVYLREGNMMRRASMHGPLTSNISGAVPVSRESISGEALVDKKTVHVADLSQARDRYPVTWNVYKELLQDRGVSEHHTMIAVPLVKDAEGIGAIMVRRAEVRPFSEKEIALLRVFADQAVIAIENVRLFNETREALEQQTGTAEILRVISRTTTDVRPVFEAIVSKARHLAGSAGARLFTYDGQLIHFETASGTADQQEWLEYVRKNFPRAPTMEGQVGPAILTKQIVIVEDSWKRQSTAPRHLVRRRVLAVPMLREGAPIGVLTVGWEEPGDVPQKIVSLIQTFADQAVIAIENVRLFNEIQEKSRQLEIANKHKSEFLANMSHELRTPLNAIIGFSEVLQDSMFGELNEEQLEFIKDIHESGKHLLSLINDILDLSKVEAGRMELVLGEFDLPSAVANALALVKERATRHRIKLTSEIDPSLGTVRADERKLKQILLNLLSNAVKFTPEGGSVKVIAKPVDNGVEIAVADTGVGIAPEDREAVFEEFRQVGKDYTRKAEGTGLGLALTRRFVQLHGGNIRLESEVGNGSTFTVFIPSTVPVMEEANGE